MKKSRLFKFITSIVLCLTTTFCCVGCDRSGGSNSTGTLGSNGSSSGYMSWEDIQDATAVRYYMFSAPVYDTAELNPIGEDGEASYDDIDSYVKKSDFFEDYYLFVDPGADSLFMNDFLATPAETKFVDMVKAEINLFTQDILQRLLTIYGSSANRANILLDTDNTGLSELLQYGDNKIAINKEKVLDSEAVSGAQIVADYDVLNTVHLSYLDELNLDTVAHDKPLCFDDAISGKYSYVYTPYVDSGTGNYEYDPANGKGSEEFVANNGGVAWAYNGKLANNELLKLNIAEIMTGVTINDLSTAANEAAFVEACEKITYLGFLNYDIIQIKNYLLNKVIGQTAANMDIVSYNSLIAIANGQVSTDNNNGYVNNQTQGQLKIKGALGFDATSYVQEVAENVHTYENMFKNAHNYKAYTTVVDKVVDNVVNERFTAGTWNKDIVFSKVPRVKLLVVPVDVIEGGDSTNYDDSDYTQETQVEFNSVLDSLNIVSIVLRPKGGLERTETVTTDGLHQYAEGINIVSFEAVFFSENYGADITVQIEGKANNEDILDELGNNYQFTETIEAGRTPSASLSDDNSSIDSYPETTFTYIIDNDKAKTEWVGNQFLGYDGNDFETMLQTLNIQPEDVLDESNEHLYYSYSLPFRLNEYDANGTKIDYTAGTEDDKVLVLSVGDLCMQTTIDDIAYIQGSKIVSNFGGNYLKVDLSIANIVSETLDTSVVTIPLTILQINPNIVLWVWGATDMIDEYANA